MELLEEDDDVDDDEEDVEEFVTVTADNEFVTVFTPTSMPLWN